MKKISISLLVFAMILGLTGCDGNYTQDANINKLSEKDANVTLESWMTKIKPGKNDPPIDLDTNNKYVEELPNIDSSFKLSVVGKNQVNFELWASTEKSGEGNDGWINRVAEKFNQSNFKLDDGRTASVSIRSIDAGTSTDYITNGKIPDAFSPANYLWGDMIESKGISINLIEERLTGNTAGILMKKSVYDSYIAKYKKLELKELLDAAILDEIMLGYTNPYTSDTAINMLTQMLLAINPNDPFSDEAEKKFLELQKHVPPPAYTTAQMRESAKKGFVDVMTMECQAYSNEPSLKDYVFTPFGVRHDNPVYVFNNISDDKLNALKLFIDFAKNEENQRLATQMGFNNNDNYIGAKSLSGSDLYNAQALWKKNKSGGRPTVAVFVVDCSGSMSGNRINSLKESLLNSMQYIGEDSEIGLVSFSQDVVIELSIGKFQGAHRGKFQSAVKGLTLRNSTHMYSGVLVALDMIQKHKEINPSDANYMIFVLSDGETNGGVSERIASELIISYCVSIHTIGYSKDADMSSLKRLSSYTEGFFIQVDEENVIYNMKNMFNSQT